VDAVRVGDFPDQARLAHARLPHDRHHLPVATRGTRERVAEGLELGLPPDEPGEPPRGGGVQPGPAGARPDHLVDVDGRLQPLDRHRAEGLHLDVAFGQPERIPGEPDGAGRGELLHPSGQVRRLAHGGVVHAEVTADGAHHDLTRVQTHPDLHLDAVRVSHLLGVAPHRGLHVVGRVARPHGVVLVGERRAKQRHDPVAHDLVHGALVAMHSLHHAFEDGVEELARLLGVAVGQELHRALEVREQYRDLLPLPFQGALRGQGLLGEVVRGITRRNRHGRSRGPRQCRAAEATEPLAGVDFGSALGAS
jgi:hypothetical protein